MGWGYGGRERLHGALRCDVMFELHRIASHRNTEITIVAALKGIEIVLDKGPPDQDKSDVQVCQPLFRTSSRLILSPIRQKIFFFVTVSSSL